MDATTSTRMNGESTASIRHDMDATRAEMDRTIGALERKLSPDALKEQAKDAAYDATVGKVGNMVRTIKDNPIPAAMAAIGIGWLIARPRMDRTVQSLGDTASHVKDRAGEVAGRVAGQAQARSRQASDAMQRTYHENPLAIGLGVVAAGVILGLALPITRKEDEWMGEARDKLATRAQGAAHEALDKLDALAQRGVAKVDERPQNAAPPNGVTNVP